MIWRVLDFTWSSSDIILDINGHKNDKIIKSLDLFNKTKKPKIIIANTTKGYGSKILEKNEWHHKFPKDEKELDVLLKSIKI